jgi:hypothetical protein
MYRRRHPRLLRGLDRDDVLLRRKLNIVFGDAFDDPRRASASTHRRLLEGLAGEVARRCHRALAARLPRWDTYARLPRGAAAGSSTSRPTMEMTRPSRYMKSRSSPPGTAFRYWRGAAFMMTDHTVGTGLNVSYLVRPRRQGGRVAGPDVRRARRDLPDVARSPSHGCASVIVRYIWRFLDYKGYGAQKIDRESCSARTMRLRAAPCTRNLALRQNIGREGYNFGRWPGAGPDGKHRTRVSPTAGGALQLSRIYCATSAKEGSQGPSFVRKCEADEGGPLGAGVQAQASNCEDGPRMAKKLKLQQERAVIRSRTAGNHGLGAKT